MTGFASDFESPRNRSTTGCERGERWTRARIDPPLAEDRRIRGEALSRIKHLRIRPRPKQRILT